MKQLLTISLLALFGLVAPGIEAKGIGCRELSYPERAQVVIVADNMIFNGVPMAAWELRWSETPEKLRAFYRSTWETRGNKVTENAMGEWKTVATADGDCFYTVQTKPTATGSYALIGVTKAPSNANPPPPGSGFPTPSGSRVLNDLRHKDGIRNARTLLLANTFSMEANASFYRNAMADHGWQPTMDRPVGTEKGPARILMWKRGAEEASMTIGKGVIGSSVAVNIVDKP